MGLLLFWFVMLLIFAAFEGATVGLTSLWFALGAFGALLVALVGGGLCLQVIVFLLVSILSLLAVRPLAQKHVNGRAQATNADRVIGMVAEVTQPISNPKGTGQITINGMPWTARSEENHDIPVGTLVRVLRLDGVKVFVEEVGKTK